MERDRKCGGSIENVDGVTREDLTEKVTFK